MSRSSSHLFRHHDDGGEPCASEASAAEYITRSLRRFRKLDLPFAGFNSGKEVKPNRLYRKNVLDAWLAVHGTYAEECAARARHTHTKYRRWIDQDGVSRAATSHKHYNRWRHMVDRCTKPENKDYDDYGGRGIKVHPAWLIDPVGYYEELDNLPAPRKGETVDRIDNDSGYEPGNLRWADAPTQLDNRREAGAGEFARRECCCWSDCKGDPLVCPVEAFDWESAREAAVVWFWELHPAPPPRALIDWKDDRDTAFALLDHLA